MDEAPIVSQLLINKFPTSVSHNSSLTVYMKYWGKKENSKKIPQGVIFTYLPFNTCSVIKKGKTTSITCNIGKRNLKIVIKLTKPNFLFDKQNCFQPHIIRQEKELNKKTSPQMIWFSLFCLKRARVQIHMKIFLHTTI